MTQFNTLNDTKVSKICKAFPNVSSAKINDQKLNYLRLHN